MNLLKLARMDQPDQPPRALTTGTVMIGRGMGCDVRIDNPTVSRRHARLDVLIDGTVRVTDLGSKNGTRVNKRVLGKEPVPIAVGECLFIGDVCFGLVTDEVPVPCIPDSEMTIRDEGPSHASVSALPYDEVLAEWERKDDAMGKAYRALFEMIGMLVSDQSLDKMVAEVLTRIQQVVAADRYAVFLGKGDTESLRLLAVRSAHRGTDSHFELSRTILNQALTERQALSLTNLPADQRFAGQDSVVLQGVHSAMVVPLIEQERVVGVLYVDSKSPIHRYDDNKLSIAVAFGHLLAAKIVQLQLLRERREKEALESEMKVAAGIQKGLMPNTLPEVPGYAIHAFLEQTRMVGGDLYDVALRNDGCVLFLQADVAGKGVGAALLAANILSAFRILRGSEDFTIEGAVERVSRNIAESSPDVQFATLFIGLLNPRLHRVDYVNAGHNPPFLIRRAGALERLASGNLPMGIVETSTWKQETIELGPGDRLLIYTDGVLDADNAAHEQYGMKRLEAYMAAHRDRAPGEFVTGLLENMDAFAGDAPQADDLTLLLVAREE